MKTMAIGLHLPKLSQEPFVVALDLPDISPENLFPRLSPVAHEAMLLSGGEHPLSQHSFIGLSPFLVLTAQGRNILLEHHPSLHQCVMNLT